MQPGFDFRIRTMIKAMTDVVIPALDPDNRAAHEQANLVAASLDMLIEQIDYAHWFETADITLMVEMASELCTLFPDDNASISADRAAQHAKLLAKRNDVTLSELRESACALRDEICALIEAIGKAQDIERLNKAQAALLVLGKVQIDRERAFVAKTRFDTSPETLLPMREALSAPVKA